MEAPAVRYVVSEGKNIAYQQWGSGEPRIVLIRAAVGNLDLSWSDPALYEALERIGRQAECVMYDQLGLGLSDPFDHVPTLEDRAADLGAVMDACRFDRATIVAIFDGSLTALVFAAQHSERVDGLLLWNPYAQGWRSAPFEQLEGWDNRDQLTAYDRAWEDTHAMWGTGASIRMQMPWLATRSNVRLWGLLERAAASPGVMRTIHDAAFAADVRDILPLVRARALVVRSAGHTLPEAVMRQVAELLPDAAYEELPETSSIAEFLGTFERRAEQFLTGKTAAPGSMRALRTVLFTDIVSSTERALEIGDAGWRQVLSDHARLVRSELDAAGGTLVDMIGDGSLSTFDGPARAIRCAERIVKGAAELGVQIRAGLHTGECELLPSGVAGVAVHIAARVSAAASGGEVLASRTVRDLVTGSGIALHSRGEHELRGLPGTWELFAVGEHTAPPAPPDQGRSLRTGDRLVLAAARSSPALLRLASRVRGRGAG